MQNYYQHIHHVFNIKKKYYRASVLIKTDAMCNLINKNTPDKLKLHKHFQTIYNNAFLK